jgi:phosphatidate cytidylyltransferase
MFWTRFRSSLIIIIITLLVVILGGDVLFATLFVVSLIGMMELLRVIGMNKALPGILVYCAGIIYYLIIRQRMQQYQVMFFIIFLMALMFVYVFDFPKYKTDQIAIAFFALFYVSVMLSYIYQVRMMKDGAITVWMIFIGAWGSDTCAYCIGILLGKHKVAPKLSPKKSLEGCIGGVVGAALIGFLFATVFKGRIHGILNPQLAFAVIGAVSSIISQIGDLAASAIKRNHDIKDYGKLIPGHGGILDRFDSIIFTAPIVYYLARLVEIHPMRP